MKKTKHGVTLVELIVVLALLGVVTVLAGTLITNMSNQYTRVATVQRAKDNVTYLQQVFENEIRYAENATLTESRSIPSGARALYSTPEGYVYSADGDTVFDINAKAYRGQAYVLQFTGLANHTIQLEITVYGRSGNTIDFAAPLYVASRSVHLLNGAVSGDSGSVLLY